MPCGPLLHQQSGLLAGAARTLIALVVVDPTEHCEDYSRLGRSKRIRGRGNEQFLFLSRLKLSAPYVALSTVIRYGPVFDISQVLS
jgi:hypothetical protein